MTLQSEPKGGSAGATLKAVLAVAAIVVLVVAVNLFDLQQVLRDAMSQNWSRQRWRKCITMMTGLSENHEGTICHG